MKFLSTTKEYDENSQKSRILYLDFIRVFSMLMILLYHFHTQASLRTLDYQGCALFGQGIHGVNTGHIGVSLFFILSGACLSISRQKFDIKRYYKKRFLAIFPSYYFVWFLVFAFSAVFLRERLQGIPPWTIIFTVLGLDGYLMQRIPNFYCVGEWFIGALILLYLIYPLLRKAKIKIPGILPIFVLFLWLFIQWILPVDDNFGHYFFLRIPEFLFGMYVMEDWKKVKWQQAFAAGLCAVLLMALPIGFGRFDVIRYALVGAGFFIVLRFLGMWLESQHWFKGIGKIFCGLSEISYEIFLIHHVTLMFVMQKLFYNVHISGGMAVGLFILWLAAVIVMAWVCHRIVLFIKNQITARR